MDKNIGFSYTYSAAANKEVLEIRKKYMPKEESKLEELRRLDREVQSAGMVPSLTVGLLGILLFGLGLCMSMEAIGGGILLGILLGIVGCVVMLFAYPVYRWWLDRVKKRLVPRILELSSELAGTEEK